MVPPSIVPSILSHLFVPPRKQCWMNTRVGQKCVIREDSLALLDYHSFGPKVNPEKL